MKNTGIIRKVDNLGRIVLPKELRKNLNIKSGDDFEIIIDSNKIILEKNLKIKSYEEVINEIISCFLCVLNYNIYIINDNMIIGSNIEISNNIMNIICERKLYVSDCIKNNIISADLIKEGKMIINPIVINSDLLGAIIIVGNDQIENMINISKIINNLIKNNIKFD